MANVERNSWRDEWISNRHRTFGKDCYCSDIDGIVHSDGVDTCESGWNVSEYYNREPYALCEYKHKNAKIDIYDAQNTVLSRLATRASLPSFLIVYDPDEITYTVIPTNDIGRSKTEKIKLSEEDYKLFLDSLRKK